MRYLISTLGILLVILLVFLSVPIAIVAIVALVAAAPFIILGGVLTWLYGLIA